MTKVDGNWEGRLVDAAGFEGTIDLEIRASREKLAGSYRVGVLAHHAAPERRGTLSGALRNNRITLKLEPSEKTDPRVQFRGDVFPCADGLGMKGAYTVAARTYSPLVGGVICASTPGARVADEEELRNPDAVEPPQPPNKRKRAKRKKVAR